MPFKCLIVPRYTPTRQLPTQRSSHVTMPWPSQSHCGTAASRYCGHGARSWSSLAAATGHSLGAVAEAIAGPSPRHSRLCYQALQAYYEHSLGGRGWSLSHAPDPSLIPSRFVGRPRCAASSTWSWARFAWWQCRTCVTNRSRHAPTVGCSRKAGPHVRFLGVDPRLERAVLGPHCVACAVTVGVGLRGVPRLHTLRLWLHRTGPFRAASGVRRWRRWWVRSDGGCSSLQHGHAGAPGFASRHVHVQLGVPRRSTCGTSWSRRPRAACRVDDGNRGGAPSTPGVRQRHGAVLAAIGWGIAALAAVAALRPGGLGQVAGRQFAPR